MDKMFPRVQGCNRESLDGSIHEQESSKTRREKIVSRKIVTGIVAAIAAIA